MEPSENPTYTSQLPVSCVHLLSEFSLVGCFVITLLSMFIIYLIGQFSRLFFIVRSAKFKSLFELDPSPSVGLET